MASPLIPVQRPDKTGKVVTRHVKADPLAGKVRTAMPAPSLGAKPTRKQPAFKPRAKQRELKRETGVWGDMDGRIERTGITQKSYYYAFTASEEEIYGVLSVVPRHSNAVKLLSEGVRSAEEARNYLSRYNLDDFIMDRSAFTDEAMRKNVRVEDFVTHTGIIGYVKPHHEPSNAADAMLFAASPLMDGNHAAMVDILEGRVSYDDMKHIGTGKLKAWGRVKGILPLLRKLKQGDAPCTIDDLKSVIAQCSSQRIEGHNFESVMRFIEAGGIDAVRATPNLLRVSTALSSQESNARKGITDGSNVFERVTYDLVVTDAINDPGSSGVCVTDEYFDAGIPVDITIEAIRSGGNIEEARVLLDARKNGVNSNFADGWL